MARASESVLITGTTSGIGRALMDHYVSLDVRVVSANRRRDAELEARYPTVRFECVDVRSAELVDDLVSRLFLSGELPEVFILNAGINALDNDETFSLVDYRRVLDTNLYGVLHFVEPLLRLPAGQGSRHVVAIGSMVRYVGNPYGLGYSSSKRALSACFDVWSQMYARTDLVFQQVLLGPVPTNIFTMAERLPAWLGRIKGLFSGSVSGAARAIARFARTRRAKLLYPRRAVPLFIALRLAQALMPSVLAGRKTLSGASRRQRE